MSRVPQRVQEAKGEEGEEGMNWISVNDRYPDDARDVLAAGSIERPLVFGNNDLPGVMLAGAVRTYVNRYAVLPGRRAVVFTDNDDGWTTAADLVAAGGQVEVTPVDDQFEEGDLVVVGR